MTTPDPVHHVTIQTNISSYIFTASAALVGVCLTVISLIHEKNLPHHSSTIADDLLTLDSLGFLVSCILSYLALRKDRFEPHPKLEKVADFLFILSLVLMVFVCGVVTYEIV